MPESPTPLPVLNQCLPKCGECCTQITPLTGMELKRVEKYLKSLPQDSVRAQVVAWDPNGVSCPFLTKDFRCFVYAVRPWVCRAFGHVKRGGREAGHLNLVCSYETDGKVRFEDWDEVRVVHETVATFEESERTGLLLTGNMGRGLKEWFPPEAAIRRGQTRSKKTKKW